MYEHNQKHKYFPLWQTCKSIHNTKHRKDNQLKTPKSTVYNPSWEYKFHIKESGDSLFNPIFQYKVQRWKHPRSSAIAEPQSVFVLEYIYIYMQTLFGWVAFKFYFMWWYGYIIVFQHHIIPMRYHNHCFNILVHVIFMTRQNYSILRSSK